jgi:dienelactone hydrolase
MLNGVRVLLLAVLVLTGGVGVASARETVEQRIEELLPGTTLLLPEGQGPFPVVIQMHGCGGVKKLQAQWAPVAQSAGWAVLVVDSYAHRNISTLEAYSTVCLGLRLWGRERAGDLYSMMEWIRHQPWADPQRIAVAGWSHGGWTALDAMALQPGEEAARETKLDGLPAEPLEGLVGVFMLYPYAGPGCIARTRGLRVDPPIQALVGASDVIVGGRGLGRALERLPTSGQPIHVTVLEGATHAFDEQETRDLRTHYDATLTSQAHAMYTSFLREAATRRSTIGPLAPQLAATAAAPAR